MVAFLNEERDRQIGLDSGNVDSEFDVPCKTASSVKLTSSTSVWTASTATASFLVTLLQKTLPDTRTEIAKCTIWRYAFHVDKPVTPLEGRLGVVGGTVPGQRRREHYPTCLYIALECK